MHRYLQPGHGNYKGTLDAQSKTVGMRRDIARAAKRTSQGVLKGKSVRKSQSLSPGVRLHMVRKG